MLFQKNFIRDAILWIPPFATMEDLQKGKDMNLASYRIRGYNIIENLEKMGRNIEFISKDTLNSFFNIVVIQNIISEKLYKHIRRRSRIVIYDINDNLLCPHHSMHKLSPYICKTADYVVCCSNYLVEKFRRFNSNCFYIPDAVGPEMNGSGFKAHNPEKEKVIVWVGSRDNLMYFNEALDPLGSLNKKYSFKVKVITSEYDGYGRSNREKVQAFKFESEFIKWDLRSCIDEILEGDIGIAPLVIKDDFCQAKSSNKILTYMFLGIPPVASAIPSYKEIIADGYNGCLAQTKEDWYIKLEKLIVNAQLRQEMGTRGKETAKDFSMDTIGKMWDNLLQEIKNK